MNNEDIAKITRDWDNYLDRLIILGYRRYAKALREQIDPILKSLEGTSSIGAVLGLSGVLISEVPIQTAMLEFLPIVADKTGRHVARIYSKYLPKDSSLGVGFGSEQFKREMASYIKEYGYDKHAKDITETTKKLVRKALQDGLDNGDTIRQVSKRVVEYTGMNKSRALMISRTETGMCAARAKELQTEDYPYEFETIWLHDHPRQPREWHLAMNMKRVEFGKERFNVGGVLMKYPHDPNGGAINVINCKCSYVNKPKEDKEGNLIRKN